MTLRDDPTSDVHDALTTYQALFQMIVRQLERMWVPISLTCPAQLARSAEELRAAPDTSNTRLQLYRNKQEAQVLARPKVVVMLPFVHGGGCDSPSPPSQADTSNGSPSRMQAPGACHP